MEYKTSEIEVKLEDTVFLVKIVKGKRKTVTLKIISGAELLVKAPSAFSNTRLKELLEKKKKSKANLFTTFPPTASIFISERIIFKMMT